MKRKYISPELEIHSLRLSCDVLELSGEKQGEIGGGGIGGSDSPTLPPLTSGGGDL